MSLALGSRPGRDWIPRGHLMPSPQWTHVWPPRRPLLLIPRPPNPSSGRPPLTPSSLCPSIITASPGSSQDFLFKARDTSRPRAASDLEPQAHLENRCSQQPGGRGGGPGPRGLRPQSESQHTRPRPHPPPGPSRLGLSAQREREVDAPASAAFWLRLSVLLRSALPLQQSSHPTKDRG